MSIYIDGKPVSIPPIGFQNTGSICYFNSLVQCLISSSFFLRFVLEKDKESQERNEIFTSFLTNITNDQWNTNFTTQLLYYVKNFQPNQSASEYFIFLVDRLGWEKLFECQYKITTKCNDCGFTKVKDDLSYNVLVNMFTDFIETETMLERVMCDGCHLKTNFTEKRKIYAVSDMIVLSLNKYFHKHLIPYPKTFKLGDYRFRLAGSLEHFGVLGAGHYNCRVKRDDIDNENKVEKYYMMDDGKVSEIDGEIFERPLNETYMIFYERIID